jgi:putative tricarboxylic transport membrane protein
MDNRKSDLLLGIVSGFIGVVIFVLTKTFPASATGGMIAGPAFFPHVLAVLFFIIAAVEIIKGSVERNEETGKVETYSVKKILMIVGLFVFYIGLFDILGFYFTTAIFLLLIQRMLGLDLKHNVIATVIIIVVIYLVFYRLFSVCLPGCIFF